MYINISITTTQIKSNNGTFILGSDNGLSIMVRDKDGFVNVTKLVNNINEREHITKLVKNIIISSDFKSFETVIYEEQGGQLNISRPFYYLLRRSFINEVRGT